MFIHSSTYRIVQIMFLTVVLLTCVYCFPVAKDPDLKPRFEHATSRFGHPWSIPGYLLPQPMRERSNIHGLNKRTHFENKITYHIAYKRRGNKNKRSIDYAVGEPNQSAGFEKFGKNDFIEADKKMSVEPTGIRKSKRPSGNNGYTGDEPVTFGPGTFNANNQPVMKTIFTKERGEPSLLRQFRRDVIPEIDLDLDRGIYKQFSDSDLNLQTLYEKKGGECTFIQGYRKSAVYVIDRCPFLYPHTDIRQLCEYVSPISKTLHNENIIEITNSPVQDRHGFVYRNFYCAQCHNARGIQAWSTSLICDDMQQLKLSDGQHDITFMGEFIDKNQGCRRVLTPVTSHGVHECEDSEIVGVMRHWHETRMGENSKNEHSPFLLSFTLFMNFGFDGKTHILFSTSPTDQLGYNICNGNEMYDPVNNKCRVMSCRDGYQLVEGSCQKTTTYEYDPTQDIDFSKMEEPLQVVLTLRNISYGMLYLLSLPGMEELVADALATQVNISRDRIQNLNVTILNNTDAMNGTLKSEIEIHRFASPEFSKSFRTSNGQQLLPVSSSRNNSNTTDITQSVGDNRMQSDDKPLDDFLFHNDSSVKNATLTDTHVPKPDPAIAGNSSSRHQHVEIPLLNHDPIPDFTTNQNEYSVRIAFILKEAYRNTTVTEKSVKGVVATMNDLIRNNSFMFTVNGTDFQIQSLENAHPTSLDNFCTKGIKRNYVQKDFTFISYFSDRYNKTDTIVYVNGTDRTYHSGEYDLTVSFDGVMTNLSRTTMDSFVIVCDTPKIENELCPRIDLEREEYEVLDNYSIHFANKTYNLSEYEYNSTADESIRICAPDWSNAQRQYNYEQWVLACGDNMITLVAVEGYLTFILGLISILSMLIVLITYGLFEKLRNLPGVNTMNLTLSLFLGELVFMVSGWIQPRAHWLCSGVGILLHYLFLASFFWMNIMAFDVYRTFAKKCILRRIRDKKKNVPRYAIYAWGSPLLIVTVCIFLDFSNSFDGVEIRYGGSSLVSEARQKAPSSNPSTGDDDSSEEIMYNIGCWIQNPVASMVAFGGPMMLILLGNFVMFTRTIICIRASTKSTRISVRRESLNHMAGRDDVMLYIRMSTVMGFTWIFGLASSVVSAFAGDPSKFTCIALHLLGILFIILNCSQGIFIFFAFVCNRRVLALYRGLFHKLKERRKRPLSVSTSRGTIYSVTNSSQSTLSTCT